MMNIASGMTTEGKLLPYPALISKILESQGITPRDNENLSRQAAINQDILLVIYLMTPNDMKFQKVTPLLERSQKVAPLLERSDI